jgi:two-component system sensor histidine kinase/response regulator
MQNRELSTPLTQKVVLNVDDNELNQLVIGKILEKAGITSIPAANGAIAIEKLRNGLKPDGILMDLQMPVMDGMETSEYIRSNIDPSIPIIINSGLISFEEKISLYRLGIRDFLEKPYTEKDILSKLARNISSSTIIKD